MTLVRNGVDDNCYGHCLHPSAEAAEFDFLQNSTILYQYEILDWIASPSAVADAASWHITSFRCFAKMRRLSGHSGTPFARQIYGFHGLEKQKNAVCISCVLNFSRRRSSSVISLSM